jgi:6-phospho-beta-glucosidase
MRLAVVGAGSTYTPELISGLDRLPVERLALHDVDRERLEIVGGLALRMLERQGFSGELDETDDLPMALDGADAVIVQIRVGGQAQRLLDETVPLELGCIGQETTGAGGFAKALRSVPVVLEIAEQVREHAAPGAWIVDFTNPVGIVTRALLDGGHRAVGLCNVNIGLQRELARLLGVAPERLLVDQVGLNHLSWVRGVLLDGADVLPDLLGEHGDELAEHVGLPRRVLDELGAVPSYYLRYFYEHDRVLAEQRGAMPRALKVKQLEEQLLDLYRDPELSTKPQLLEERGGAFYSEAALGLLGALTSGSGAIHVVDLRSGGAVPGLANDDVVEIAARIGPDGAEPLPQAELAPELLGLVQHVTAYERLTVAAALTGSRSLAVRALLAHPLIGQLELAEELVEKMLAASGDFLPRFAATGRA